MAIQIKTAASVSVDTARFSSPPLMADNALYVSTSSDYITLPNTWLWGSTWSCFFKANIFSTPSAAARLMSNDSEELILTVTGIKVQQGGANITSDSGTLILNEWHDYAITYDGTYVKFYRDMALVSVKELSTAPSSNAWGWYLLSNPAHTRNCDMYISRFQFYSNRAFTAEGIVSHYRNAPNDKNNMSIYLKLNEGTGATATDSSGNGRNSTITGCSWVNYTLQKPTTTYGDTQIA